MPLEGGKAEVEEVRCVYTEKGETLYLPGEYEHLSKASALKSKGAIPFR